MQPVLFADDPQFWFETLRTMGHAAYGGADIGEVLTTAQNIVAGDYDSWHDQWLAIADKIAAEAETQLAAGHRTSARDGLMRASIYYRTMPSSSCMATPPIRASTTPIGAPRSASTTPQRCSPQPSRWWRSPTRTPCCTATSIVPLTAEATARRARPWSCITASTAPQRRCTHNGAAAGSERGYHVLTFDGPGQPAARHLDGLVFRPDWENVVTPVLDWVMARPEVDESRVGLLGLSMGGLLAPRAAAFEHRLAACVAVDGIYELGATVLSHFPGSRAEVEAALRAERAPEVDAAMENLMANDPTVRWAITNGMYVMGMDSPRAFAACYLDYTLAGGIAEQITCPTLVCDGESDMFWPGQPQELFDHLTCPKTLLRFTNAEGAGAHCSIRGSAPGLRPDLRLARRRNGD